MATYSSSPMTEVPTMERDGFVLARLDEVVQAARTDSLWLMTFGLRACYPLFCQCEGLPRHANRGARRHQGRGLD